MDTFLKNDPRTVKLTDLLIAIGEPKIAGIGTAVAVLRWAMHHAPNGDLSVFKPEVIERGIEWHRDEPLMPLLEQAGFVESGRFLGFKELAESYQGFVNWADAED